MQQAYLDTDSKGIIPMDLEGRAEYLFRGKQFQTWKISAAFAGLHLKVEISKAKAPKGVYKFMEEKYSCDVRWVHYFESKGDLEISEDGKWTTKGLCGGLTCGYPWIIVTDYPVNRMKNDTAVHEFIHAVREPFTDYKRSNIAEELIAYSFKESREHYHFDENPTKAVMMELQRDKAYENLHKCFGDKASYCLIRLKWDEIEKVSSLWFKKSLTNYFKKRANLSHRRGLADKPAGELRFQIMCEKMGL